MGRGKRVTHPLTSQARSLSARYWMLEPGDMFWRRVCLGSRTRKQVEHPALTTQGGQLS